MYSKFLGQVFTMRRNAQALCRTYLRCRFSLCGVDGSFELTLRSERCFEHACSDVCRCSFRRKSNIFSGRGVVRGPNGHSRRLSASNSGSVGHARNIKKPQGKRERHPQAKFPAREQRASMQTCQLPTIRSPLTTDPRELTPTQRGTRTSTRN